VLFKAVLDTVAVNSIDGLGAEVLKGAMMPIFTEYGLLGKIDALVSDSAAVMPALHRLLAEDIPTLKHGSRVRPICCTFVCPRNRKTKLGSCGEVLGMIWSRA